MAGLRTPEKKFVCWLCKVLSEVWDAPCDLDSKGRCYLVIEMILLQLAFELFADIQQFIAKVSL